jgi:hypothetical protein
VGENLHIFELFSGFGEDDCLNVDDIFVLEQFEQSQLPQSAFCEDLVLESFVNFFDGYQVLPFGF